MAEAPKQLPKTEGVFTSEQKIPHPQLTPRPLSVSPQKHLEVGQCVIPAWACGCGCVGRGVHFLIPPPDTAHSQRPQLVETVTSPSPLPTAVSGPRGLGRGVMAGGSLTALLTNCPASQAVAPPRPGETPGAIASTLPHESASYPAPPIFKSRRKATPSPLSASFSRPGEPYFISLSCPIPTKIS